MYLVLDGQIKVFESEAGVSLRKDVLGSMGDEIVSFSETNCIAQVDLVSNFHQG